MTGKRKYTPQQFYVTLLQKLQITTPGPRCSAPAGRLGKLPCNLEVAMR
jgi:hypothetical protein